MANATPVHPKTPEKSEGQASKKPDTKPDTSKPEKVQVHIPAAPGNYYELPDGTIVRDL